MLLLKLKRNVCALVTTSLMFGPQHLLFINFEVLICHNASIYTAETNIGTGLYEQETILLCL